MYRIWIGIAGFFGLTAVIMVALASHAFVGRIDPASLDIVKTGIDIEIWHALALLTLGVSSDRLGRWRLRAGAMFTLGTLLFCAAVYVRGLTGHSLDGVAPAGGICLMLGWLSLLVGAMRGF